MFQNNDKSNEIIFLARMHDNNKHSYFFLKMYLTSSNDLKLVSKLKQKIDFCCFIVSKNIINRNFVHVEALKKNCNSKVS